MMIHTWRKRLRREHKTARIDIECLHRIHRLQEKNVLAREADEEKIAHEKPLLHAKTTFPMILTRVRNLNSYLAVHPTNMPP